MNKVTYGLKNVYVAFRDNESSDTEPVWLTPVAIPGAVNLKPKPEGSQAKFFADDALYFAANANDGYTADLEVALLSDEILAEMLGWSVDDNGALVEITDGISKRFALMGQVTGDVKNRKFVYFDCEASRPSREEKTKSDKLEPNTDTISLTIFPIEVDGMNLVKLVMEATDANSGIGGAYTDFFAGVYVPVITPEA